MRIAITPLLSASLLALAASASAQPAGAPPPPGSSNAPSPGWSPPGVPQPVPTWAPPPATPAPPGGAIAPLWSPPAPPPLAFTPGAPPPSPQSAQSPPPSPEPVRSDAPIELAHRVGFGLGFWLSPLGLGGGAGAAGALGGLGGEGTQYGGTLGVRFWVRERVVLIPSLVLGVTRKSIPDNDQTGTHGGNFTEGTFAPSLSVGYAAYRGKTSRFLVVGGLGFEYDARATQITVQDASGSFHGKFVGAKALSFEVPVGFAFEQFFSSKISVSLGAGAPLFQYTRGKTDTLPAQTSISASFSAAQLSAAVQLYTD